MACIVLIIGKVVGRTVGISATQQDMHPEARGRPGSSVAARDGHRIIRDRASSSPDLDDS